LEVLSTASAVPLAFSPDSRRLALSRGNSGVEVYDFIPPSNHLSAKELDGLWEALGAGDKCAGSRTALMLAAAPKDAVPFLHERLRPVPPDVKRLKKLLAELDDDSFERREAAVIELRKVGHDAERILREARDRPASAELRREIDSWLSADSFRTTIALQVLERIGNEESRRALAQLAEAKDDPWLAKEARAALERMKCGGDRK
jgi:hypothetical protein